MMKLRPVTFDWKDAFLKSNSIVKKSDIGFIFKMLRMYFLL
ncbi:MAG: hypothetical protein CL842_04770 [Crocinitomicaceae bacterium]|nr:hypothetical protein [Crocinitomicaceae bacterium]